MDINLAYFVTKFEFNLWIFLSLMEMGPLLHGPVSIALYGSICFKKRW